MFLLFGSFANFAQLTRMAKFNKGPKCAAVKVTPLTEVALVDALLPSKTLEMQNEWFEIRR